MHRLRKLVDSDPRSGRCLTRATREDYYAPRVRGTGTSVMTQSSGGILPLRNNQDVVVCRQAVRRLANESGFGVVGQTMLMTAASELARNTLKYGGGGHVIYEVIGGRSVGIRLVFVDHGPGIADIQQAMVDGWTSGRGMGLGLGGAKRLVHEFDIVSSSAECTTVTVVRWK